MKAAVCNNGGFHMLYHPVVYRYPCYLQKLRHMQIRLVLNVYFRTFRQNAHLFEGHIADTDTQALYQ